MENFFKKIKDETDKKFGGANKNSQDKKDSNNGSSWTGGNNLSDNNNKNDKPTPKPLPASLKNPFEKKNPFANIGPKKKFSGGGQSLGGAKPGKVIAVVLEKTGPLGVKVEKRSKNQPTAIVAAVAPESQAGAANLQRGDIICHAGSNGQEEIMYEQFLAMAASDQRPLVFDVRRVDGAVGAGHSSAAAAATTSSKGVGGGLFQNRKKESVSSAEAYARKQAVIAAAEARDKAHKAKTKQVTKKKNNTLTNNNATSPNQEICAEPKTEQARKAVEDSKRYEVEHAAKLGYNPYETARMGAGQARNATVAMTHGTMNAGAGNETNTTTPAAAAVLAPNRVAPPSNPVQPTEDVDMNAPINPAFDEAYTTIILSSTSQSTTLSSFSIMRKLIVNATTKGQTGDEATSSKFRRVRLSNAKIAAAITHVSGALELMLSVGFELSENAEDGETYLVYPPGEKGPGWLGRGLKRMELYEKNSGST